MVRGMECNVMLMILEREQDESVHHSRDKQDGTHREPSQRVSRDAQRVESVVVVRMICHVQ